jgi:hypothetical protein
VEDETETVEMGIVEAEALSVIEKDVMITTGLVESLPSTFGNAERPAVRRDDK